MKRAEKRPTPTANCRRNPSPKQKKRRPSAALLAAGSFNSFVKMWCVATGKVKAVLQGKACPDLDGTLPVSSVAFSPDGKLLAAVGGSGLDLEEWEEPQSHFIRSPCGTRRHGKKRPAFGEKRGRCFRLRSAPTANCWRPAIVLISPSWTAPEQCACGKFTPSYRESDLDFPRIFQSKKSGDPD